MSRLFRIADSEINIASSGGRTHETSSALIVGTVALACLAGAARADEGGVSFWLPGFFGSLAAAPLQPGWSLTNIYYHTSVRWRRCAGTRVRDQASPRQSVGKRGSHVLGQRECRRRPRHRHADLYLRNPRLRRPGDGRRARIIWRCQHLARWHAGGHAQRAAIRQLAVLALRQHQRFGVGFRRPDADRLAALGCGRQQLHDLHHWRRPGRGVRLNRLSNIGIGHGAIDAGFGYTYLNPQTGHEFSGVLGFTYNFENQSTQYQNGVDMHFDWAASQFLTKQ